MLLLLLLLLLLLFGFFCDVVENSQLSCSFYFTMVAYQLNHRSSKQVRLEAIF